MPRRRTTAALALALLQVWVGASASGGSNADLLDRVRTLAQEGRFEPALEAAEAARRTASGRGAGAEELREIELEIAQLQQRLGRYDEAAALLEQIVEGIELDEGLLSEELVGPLEGLALAFLASGRGDEAAEVYRRIAGIWEAADMLFEATAAQARLGMLHLTRHDEPGMRSTLRALRQLETRARGRGAEDDDIAAQLAGQSASMLASQLGEGDAFEVDEILDAIADAGTEEPIFAIVAKIQRGFALEDRGEVDAAAAVYTEAVEAGDLVWPEGDPARARLRACRAGLDLATARHLAGPAARKALERARGGYEESLETLPARGSDDDDRRALELAHRGLGAALLALDQPELATEHLDHAESFARSRLGRDHPFVAAIQALLGAARQAAGDIAGARRHAAAARTGFDDALPADHPLRGLPYDALVERYAEIARSAEVQDLAQELLWSLRAATRGPDHPDLADDLVAGAESIGWAARHSEVEGLLRRALTIRTESLGAAHPQVALVEYRLAEVLGLRRRPEEALEHARRATEIARSRLGSTAIDPAARSEEVFLRPGLFVHLGLLATIEDPASANHAQEAFDVGQLLLHSRAGDTLRQAAARLDADRGEVARLGRALQDAEHRWQALDGELAQAIRVAPEGRDRLAEAGLRHERDAASLEVDELEERLAEADPGFSTLLTPGVGRWEQIASLLSGDEALLLLVLGDRSSFGWLGRQDGLQFAELSITASEAERQVARLRRTLDPSAPRGLEPLAETASQFDLETAWALYEALVAPFEASLAGIHHVATVTEGPIESIPLALLLTAPPLGSEPLTGQPWALRRWATSTLPSPAALPLLRTAIPPSAAPEPFLGIGEPLLDRPGGGRPERRNALAHLAPLPESGDELRTLGALLGAGDDDLLLAAQATEAALRGRDLAGYRTIAFATHGLRAGEIPGVDEPALVLSSAPALAPDDDGLLLASEITGLELDADWVLLSACNTAAGDGSPAGGALDGLARSFLYAGARALLVSHWSVDSDAAVELTTGTFGWQRRDPTLPPAEALRRAQLDLLARGAPWDRPALWAPFVLVGDGWRHRSPASSSAFRTASHGPLRRRAESARGE